MILGRRTFIALAGSAMLADRSSASPAMRVHKDPTCGCCSAWIDHVRGAGYAVEAFDTNAMQTIKRRLGVPDDLRSCHTAEIESYVIEGHVPARAIAALLRQRPNVVGLAVPGMPIGSPGMEIDGNAAEVYAVIAFGSGHPTTFMRFKGHDPI
ncbi:MAG: metal-binding protein [Leifsonia xyli]|nr:MAG: metal-binding protein [Leifsonia xyli]